MRSFVLTSLVFCVTMLSLGCGGEAAKPTAPAAPAGGAAVPGDAAGAPGGPAPTKPAPAAK